MAQVVFENVYKSFPRRLQDSDRSQSNSSEVCVLRNINLTVQDGEFMVLVGQSGCGKSTLLRLLAGLESLTGGNIYIGDRSVNSLPPKARDIAMVFQNYALYPHLDVYDNIAFGLRRSQSQKPAPIEDFLRSVTRSLPRNFRYQSPREKAIAESVTSVAQLLQIEPLLSRLPKELSGGQKQRVALGRAIARSPQVFLMDEPLSNLDAKLRTETRGQIVELQKQLNTTTIYVTHDQTEAMTMGDRIAVMDRGQIQQVAPPLEVYSQPANQFVAGFIGSPPMNFISVEWLSQGIIRHPQFKLTLEAEWAKILSQQKTPQLVLGIRPQHLQLATPETQDFIIQVNAIEALGNETYIYGSLAEHPEPLTLAMSGDLAVTRGQQLPVRISRENLHLFAADTGQSLKEAAKQL